MIEILLEAYEMEIINQNSQQNKKIGDGKREFILKGFIILMAYMVINIALVLYPDIIIYIFVLFFFLLGLGDIALKKSLRKRWRENIKNHNAELNIIANILKSNEFNLYTKTKIEHLIEKIHQEMDYEDKTNSQKRNERKAFILSYIFPIISFFVGASNVKSIESGIEILSLGINVALVIVAIRIMYESTLELIRNQRWSKLAKLRNFVMKLQDLVDRDFDVEQENVVH